jgi:K+/H+ antiporter YhaU regulatory subunit KhtT
MRFKTFKVGKPDEEPKEEVIETNGATFTQINDMEEQINSKTKDLEEKTQKLQELSDTVNENKKVDERPRPHGPLSELSVEPEDKMTDLDFDLESDAGTDMGTENGVNLVEINTAPVIPEETPQVELGAESGESTQELKEESQEVNLAQEDDDGFSNLFSNEEEEINPLANLINSLPDVTAQELIDDLKEIKDIIQDWQKS